MVFRLILFFGNCTPEGQQFRCQDGAAPQRGLPCMAKKCRCTAPFDPKARRVDALPTLLSVSLPASTKAANPGQPLPYRQGIEKDPESEIGAHSPNAWITKQMATVRAA